VYPLAAENLIVLQKLLIVLDVVCQLNRQPVGRVRNDLQVVRTILVTRMNARNILLMYCVGEFVERSSHEILA